MEIFKRISRVVKAKINHDKAEARIELQKTSEKINFSSGIAAFERMENKVMSIEAEAFSTDTNKDSIDSELEKLKKQLNDT